MSKHATTAAEKLYRFCVLSSAMVSIDDFAGYFERFIPQLSLLLLRRRGVGCWLVIMLCLAALVPQQVGAQPLIVNHIRPESDTDMRHQYYIRLLDLVLSKTKGAYQLSASEQRMQQGRALVQLGRSDGIDIVWTMTSETRERQLLPIRIPLHKGLIGARLLLIKKEDEHLFKRIKTDGQLKILRAGQGHDWPDKEIMEYNGYTVTGSASYDALFKMLQKRRIEYFPRSVLEVQEEAEAHADKGLVIDKAILIQYPAAVYFFVNKNNQALASRVQEGLRRAIADGSFDTLFYETYNHVIERADLSNRIRFDLENPLLSPETPLEQPNLWYQY